MNIFLRSWWTWMTFNKHDYYKVIHHKNKQVYLDWLVSWGVRDEGVFNSNSAFGNTTHTTIPYDTTSILFTCSTLGSNCIIDSIQVSLSTYVCMYLSIYMYLSTLLSSTCTLIMHVYYCTSLCLSLSLSFSLSHTHRWTDMTIITIRESAWLTDDTYKYEQIVNMMGEVLAALKGDIQVTKDSMIMYLHM